MKTLLVALFGLLATRSVLFADPVVSVPDHLTCESLVNPLAVDASVPRLSWQLNDARQGVRQTAYQVLVSSAPDQLADDNGDLWDSGIVDSGQSVYVPYRGSPLSSFQDVFWKVRIKDQNGAWSLWSRPADWRMGLLSSNDWENAQWIGLKGDPRKKSPLLKRVFSTKKWPSIPTQTFPAPLLRRKFTLHGPIKQATAYVCGLGYFELYLNGKKIGNHELDPIQTSYNLYADYVAFDVTEKLKEGVNAVGLALGNGFYGQNFAFQPFKLLYGKPMALALLHIEYADGSVETVVSDPDWKVATGPVVFDNVYAGETYDARLEIPGWSTAGFNDSSWTAAELREAPGPKLSAQMVAPMRKIRSLKPVAVFLANDGGWILDMGQNMTGWLQIRVRGTAGQEIRMRFGETLMPGGGELDYATTGTYVTGLPQTDIYVCKGNGTETWEPQFTYHGFRYVHLNGWDQKPDPNDFTGWLIRSDLPKTGSFECSDPLINKFYTVSRWTLEDNLQGILSDCPIRERCEWMGDMIVDGETASCNFDLAAFWKKTATDIRVACGTVGPQGIAMPRDRRSPPNIAIGNRSCGQARPDWGMAAVLVPWYSYLYFGDVQTVETAWPMMQGWIAFLAEHGLHDGIIEEGYGDWCQPGPRYDKMDTPVPLTSTALYYQCLTAMQRMAGVLDKESGQQQYAALAKAVYKAFNRKFFSTKTKDYGTQTADAMALSLGLVPEDMRPGVSSALKKRVMVDSKGHDFTGIMGRRYLYTTLNDCGDGEVTRLLWSRTDWPSLGFLTEKLGMTTWPEHSRNQSLNERYGGISLNHPMQSGFSVSFFESIGGIRPADAGFKKIIFQPCFLPGMEWAKVEHESPYGRISSHWKKENGRVVWEIVVPPNSSAEVRVPVVSDKELVEMPDAQRSTVCFLGDGAGYKAYGVSAGSYRFTVKIPEGKKIEPPTAQETPKVKSSDVAMYTGGEVMLDGKKCLKLGDTPALGSTDSYTWSFEVRISTGSPLQTILLGNRITSGLPGLNFVKITADGALLFGGSRPNSCMLKAALHPGKWISVKLRKDDGKATLYVNGNEVASDDVKFPLPAMPCYLGGDPLHTVECSRCMIRNPQMARN